MKRFLLSMVALIILGTTACFARSGHYRDYDDDDDDDDYYGRKVVVVHHNNCRAAKRCKCYKYYRKHHKGYRRPVRGCYCPTCRHLRARYHRPVVKTEVVGTWRGPGYTVHTVYHR